MFLGRTVLVVDVSTKAWERGNLNRLCVLATRIHTLSDAIRIFSVSDRLEPVAPDVAGDVLRVRICDSQSPAECRLDAALGHLAGIEPRPHRFVVLTTVGSVTHPAPFPGMPNYLIEIDGGQGAVMRDGWICVSGHHSRVLAYMIALEARLLDAPEESASVPFAEGLDLAAPGRRESREADPA